MTSPCVAESIPQAKSLIWVECNNTPAIRGGEAHFRLVLELVSSIRARSHAAEQLHAMGFPSRYQCLMSDQDAACSLTCCRLLWRRSSTFNSVNKRRASGAMYVSWGFFVIITSLILRLACKTFFSICTRSGHPNIWRECKLWLLLNTFDGNLLIGLWPICNSSKLLRALNAELGIALSPQFSIFNFRRRERLLKESVVSSSFSAAPERSKLFKPLMDLKSSCLIAVK